jgi:hypothetical protein
MSDTTTKLHLHVGWNMPGYMPESDPSCFDSWDNAKQYLIDTLLEHADSTASWADEHDCDDVPCPTYGDSCPNQKASDLSNTAEELNLENGPEWGAFAGDLNYWIFASDERDCEQDDTKNDDHTEAEVHQHMINLERHHC